MTNEKEKINLSALFRIGYGLYVLTTNDGRKDNGCIVNSVMQVTSNPLRVAVCVNKQNYSCGTILETLKMNINCLSVDATFDVFKRFGFQSGKTVDKFFGETPKRSENGLVVMPEFATRSYPLRWSRQSTSARTTCSFVPSKKRRCFPISTR